MIAIQVVDERFTGPNTKELAFNEGNRGNGEFTVRRPTRGTVNKEDTYATMRIVAADGKTLAVTDAGGNLGSSTAKKTGLYSNFLLQQVTEERVEKQQILETFGEPYIFLFGERARMISFSGILINTFDFNWEAEWWDNYEKYLRGTRCVEQDARVYLSYDETLVSGYIIASSAVKDSQNKNHVQFQFTMFVTSYATFSDLGNGTAIPVGARARATINRDTFEIQAPKALLPGQALLGQIVDGKVNMPTLIEGLTDGLGTVMKTWNKAQAIVNNATTALSDLARGDTLSVPFGFSGVLAYDQPDVIKIPFNIGGSNPYGAIRYTQFSDNKDEYVGSSSHYGSSLIPNLLPPAQSFLSRGTQLLNQVNGVFAAAGFSLPTDKVAEVANFVASEGSGLIAAGGSAAWQISETVDSGLSPVSMSPLDASR